CTVDPRPESPHLSAPATTSPRPRACCSFHARAPPPPLGRRSASPDSAPSSAPERSSQSASRAFAATLLDSRAARLALRTSLRLTLARSEAAVPLTPAKSCSCRSRTHRPAQALRPRRSRNRCRAPPPLRRTPPSGCERREALPKGYQQPSLGVTDLVIARGSVAA